MARKNASAEAPVPVAEPSLLHGLNTFTRSLVHSTGLREHVDQTLPATPRVGGGSLGRVYRPGTTTQQPAA